MQTITLPNHSASNPDPAAEFTFSLRPDESILYIKSSALVTPESLQEHYTRLSGLQPQLDREGYDTIIYDFTSVQDEMPYMSLISAAQKARKQLDPVQIKKMFRVFVVNEPFESLMLQIWMRLTSRFTAMRICTTFEDAYKEIERWRAARSQ